VRVSIMFILIKIAVIYNNKELIIWISY